MASTRSFARLLRLVEALLSFGALYHYWLLIASLWKRPIIEAPTATQHRFAIVIPAHNEATVIGNTVHRLRQIAYPSLMFDVVVVADHCSDQTAQIVRHNGGICYERFAEPRGRKGYALAWLFARLVADATYDAIVVLDADSHVVPEFLTAFNAALNAGYRAAQGQHIIANPFDTTYSGLAAIDMRLNNRLRNLARHNLGYSARLMGDAMCFERTLLIDYPWDTVSLVEDIEYGIRLAQYGVQIAYVDRAISYGEAAGGWQQAEKQRVRWEGGVLDLRRRLPWRLVLDGFRRRRWELVDRGIELIMPPYTVLTVIALLVAGFRLLLAQAAAAPFAVSRFVLPAAFGALPVLGLTLDRASPKLYLALLFGPFYLFWRVFVRIRAILHRGHIEWIRTPRKAERLGARN